MTNPIFTVNSPFLAINSFVPSSGSTKKKVSDDRFLTLFSSEIIGIFLNSFFNFLQIILLDSVSAKVNGELSLL